MRILHVFNWHIRLVLALLIGNRAGCLTCRLTRSLTLSAAALFSRCLQISLVDCSDVLHRKPSPNITILYIITHFLISFKPIPQRYKKFTSSSLFESFYRLSSRRTAHFGIHAHNSANPTAKNDEQQLHERSGTGKTAQNDNTS